MEQKIQKESHAGHIILEDCIYEVKEKISNKIKENILSGRWLPETKAEHEMLKEHLKHLYYLNTTVQVLLNNVK